jgi:hypothetical protein
MQKGLNFLWVRAKTTRASHSGHGVPSQTEKAYVRQFTMYEFSPAMT